MAYGQEQQFRVTAPVANVRLEATTSSPVVTQVKAGTVLKVIDENSGWVKVALPPEGGFERVGYISKSLGVLENAPAAIAPVPVLEMKPKQTYQPEPAPRSYLSPASAENPKEAWIQTKPAMMTDQSKKPGQFGIGIQLGVNPSGISPSVLYDFKASPATIRGLFGFGTGWSVLGAQGLYRFSTTSTSDSSVAVVPYIGGGLIVLNVNYGSWTGSQSFTGFLGSGGMFVTFKSLPAVRFSAELNVPVYNYGRYSQPVLYGAYLGLGGHYFFPQSK